MEWVPPAEPGICAATFGWRTRSVSVWEGISVHACDGKKGRALRPASGIFRNLYGVGRRHRDQYAVSAGCGLLFRGNRDPRVQAENRRGLLPGQRAAWVSDRSQ